MSLRLCLLPIYLVVELALLAAAWSVVRFHPNTAHRIKDWAMLNIPDPDWYRQ